MSHLVKQSEMIKKAELISVDDDWYLNTEILKASMEDYFDPFTIGHNNYMLSDVLGGAVKAGIDIGILSKVEYADLMENFDEFVDSCESWSKWDLLKAIKNKEAEIDPDDKYIMVIYDPSRKIMSSNTIYDNIGKIRDQYYNYIIKEVKAGNYDKLAEHDITSYILDNSLVSKKDID